MNILITNDDGIWAAGLAEIRRTLEDIGQVTVVAPEKQQSATGHGITVHKPLRAEKVSFENSPSEGYAVNGTPSDCVKLAVEVIMKDNPPDIVVSGINQGPNLGTDVLYSGTVSGALEGIINDIPAMGISVATYENSNFSYAARFGRYLAEEIVRKKLAKDTFLNVNIPDVSEDKIKGVMVTRLGKRKYENAFETRVDPRGRPYYWLVGDVLDIDKEPETDIYAIHNNYVSVTPVHFDLTNYNLINQINQWRLKIK